jgi:hypothetical protein
MKTITVPFAPAMSSMVCARRGGEGEGGGGGVEGGRWGMRPCGNSPWAISIECLLVSGILVSVRQR